MRHEINKNYDAFMISNHSSIDFAISIEKFPDFIRFKDIKCPPLSKKRPISRAKDLMYVPFEQWQLKLKVFLLIILSSRL